MNSRGMLNIMAITIRKIRIIRRVRNKLPVTFWLPACSICPITSVSFMKNTIILAPIGRILL